VGIKYLSAMEPKIIQASPMRLLGMRKRMSWQNDETASLWRSFRPELKRIPQRVNSHFYSLQRYPSAQAFLTFNPDLEFEKWAAVAVDPELAVPIGLEALDLQGGLYAVFNYRGPAANFAPFFELIFRSWLPSAAYELDDRPHFEVLGENYRPDDPGAEEEIWIPVRLSSS
jgi:AraC family transcriptional regulator